MPPAAGTAVRRVRRILDDIQLERAELAVLIAAICAAHDGKRPAHADVVRSGIWAHANR